LFDLRRLEAFVAFAESGSFTRAAKAIHISQPALFMQVRKLAEELGVELYARRGARVLLTPEGERVAAFGRELRAQASALEAALRGEPIEAPLVLAAGEGAYLYLLGPALRAMSSTRTSTSVGPLRLITRDGEGTLQAVRSGEAHLGVLAVDAMTGTHSISGGVTASPLTEVGHVLAVPRRHALAARRRIRLADLAGMPLVAPERGRPHRAMLERALASAGVRCEVVVEANGWELMLHFVSLGTGVAIVNACCRMPAGVVARPIEGLTSVRYFVVRRTQASGDARIARAAAILHEHANQVT
jgi:DNA-binding transcriptional LysR family regulator